MKTTKLGNTLYEADPPAPVAEHTRYNFTPETARKFVEEYTAKLKDIQNRHAEIGQSVGCSVHKCGPHSCGRESLIHNLYVNMLMFIQGQRQADQQTIRELTEALERLGYGNDEAATKGRTALAAAKKGA